MGRKITFLGFSTADVPPDTAFAGEVWTVNDWYSFYPWLKHPGRVYQIHRNFTGHATDRARAVNWRAEYNASGAEIVARSPLPGVERVRLFDDARATAVFGDGFFTSCFSFLFAEAIWEAVESISLAGIRLDGESEYAKQAPGMVRSIHLARSRGIQVSATWEHLWGPLTVDWAGLREVQTKYGD